MKGFYFLFMIRPFPRRFQRHRKIFKNRLPYKIHNTIQANFATSYGSVAIFFCAEGH